MQTQGPSPDTKTERTNPERKPDTRTKPLVRMRSPERTSELDPRARSPQPGAKAARYHSPDKSPVFTGQPVESIREEEFSIFRLPPRTYQVPQATEKPKVSLAVLVGRMSRMTGRPVGRVLPDARTSASGFV